MHVQLASRAANSRFGVRGWYSTFMVGDDVYSLPKFKTWVPSMDPFALTVKLAKKLLPSPPDAEISPAR